MDSILNNDSYSSTDNIRIKSRRGLVPPIIMVEETPVTDQASQIVEEARLAASRIIQGHDDRLLVIAGPCSIHDMDAALEYGERLCKIRKQLTQDLCIIMRVYFEKPRTTIGWKGFINDPTLNGKFEINKGLRLARNLLDQLSAMGIACATEFLDTITPQFIADLIAWGAIGARTTESQIHRELASGLSMPIGFKNATNGDIQVAVDAVKAAKASHHFLSVTKQGNTAIFETEGNHDAHIILRGGKSGPNYDSSAITNACQLLEKAHLKQKLVVDCSHGNSEKDYRKQPIVAAHIAEQIRQGNQHIAGVMLESHLTAGNQPISQRPLTYGQSITDACISWETTIEVLQQLAQAVQQRRATT